VKYFEIPPNEEVQDAPPDPKTGKQPTISFSQICDEQVWGAEIWRKSDENAELLITLRPQIRGKPPGTRVELSAKAYEIFLPLITMEGQRVNPMLAVELAKLARPVRRALEQPPEKATE